MNTYIVYVDGTEAVSCNAAGRDPAMSGSSKTRIKGSYIKAVSRNAAERKAQAKYPGRHVSVAYTEL